jgi:pimeloyl-ACP methyl ester carboxylesterase
MATVYLLHGALGCALDLEPLRSQLETNFDVRSVDFWGHGGSALPENEELSIQQLTAQVHDGIQAEASPVHIFGYSMGGYVALKLAAAYPHLVTSIVTYGTKFDWSPEALTLELPRLKLEFLQAKAPAYVEALALRHRTPVERLLGATARLMELISERDALASSELASLNLPVLLLRGSKDKMVTVAETTAIAQQLPQAVFQELDGQPHALEQVAVTTLAAWVRDHFNQLSIQT